jgi:RNAse (barnase) inhibitor barstar
MFKSRVEKWPGQELQLWMIDNNLETIYVDDHVRRYDALWALIKSQIGTSMEIAFSSDNENIQILRTTKAPS